MNLKQFMITNLKANQENKHINLIIEIISNDVNFSETKDIK